MIKQEVCIVRLRCYEGPEGRPCRALGSYSLCYPGFGRPYRATHPGLWWGRPAGAYSIRL